jgi:DegV family protein with EDD domain
VPRSAVLVVDPSDARRRALAEGLSAFGFEVVPTGSDEEAARFVAALMPSVIVSPRDGTAFGGADGAEEIPGLDPMAERPFRVLLGARGVSDEDDDEQESDDVAVLALEENGQAVPLRELLRRLRLVLVGREVGLAPDARHQTLMGDLSRIPLLELVRSLGADGVSGRMLVEDGEVVFDRGQVVAATAGRSGAVDGIKAFCRLARRREGLVRVMLGRAGVRRQIDVPLDTLVIRAVEDLAQADLPDLKSRLVVDMGPEFFARQFGRSEQQLLSAAQRGGTVGELLDRFQGTDGQILAELAHLQEAGVVRLEEPAARVVVVTDSTCDLPERLVRDHGLRVVPLTVRFGDDLYRDGVDIRPKEFYAKLGQGPHPKSSPPTPGEFREVYRGEVGAHDVVSVHLSSVLSETAANARQAQKDSALELAQARGASADRLVLEIVDSHQVSLGLGLLALFAARMARRGLGAAEIARRVEEMRDRVQILFVVDNLDSLARGGRIGKARALVGNLLRVKPILGVQDGQVVPVDRVRGGRGAHPKILERFRQGLDPELGVIAAVGHAAAPKWADRLRGLLEEELSPTELLLAEIGPVVGTHAGPGTVGAALFQPTADEADLVAPLD